MKFLLIIGLLFLALGVFIGFRNFKVFNFRFNILLKCRNWAIKTGDNSSFDWFKSMPNYNVMLFSIKRLTEENWLPEDIIKKLNN